MLALPGAHLVPPYPKGQNILWEHHRGNEADTTSFTFTSWLPLPAANGFYHQKVHAEGICHFFAMILQRLVRMLMKSKIFQNPNLAKPKPCRQQLRVKNLQQRGLRHTTRSNRHLCPNIELVTSFLNCCLEAKGMSQYTDPFVAHPFLAEHRRHQKKHCQVSATKSCMASFSQGRCVEHLGSRKSPTSLAAKGFIYCSSMSGAWTDMPIAHDNIM